MRFLIPLLTLFLLPGCTAVAVRGPIGTPISVQEINGFVGDWIGGGRSTLTVERLPESGLLRAKWVENGELKSVDWFPTKFKHDCTLFWGVVQARGFFAPVRAIIGDGTLVLLAPDLDEIKRLAAEGLLTVAPEKADGLYLIEARGLENYISSNTFWALDSAIPVLKNQRVASLAKLASEPLL